MTYPLYRVTKLATNVVTYQGLSRNTYTNLRATLTAQSGALGFDDMAASYDAAQRGSDSPNLIITTPAVATIYEQIVTPTLNINLGQQFTSNAPAGGQQGIN